MAAISPHQYSALRSLHLNFEWAAFDSKFSHSALLHTVQSPALRTLEICIKKRSRSSRYLTTIYLILRHTTALEKVTVTIPPKGPYGYRPLFPHPIVLPHPLGISESSRAKLLMLNGLGPLNYPLWTNNKLDPAWECIEWPAERQLEFADSVRVKVWNPWASLEPRNYVQDDRPPRFVLFNSMERVFWEEV